MIRNPASSFDISNYYITSYGHSWPARVAGEEREIEFVPLKTSSQLGKIRKNRKKLPTRQNITARAPNKHLFEILVSSGDPVGRSRFSMEERKQGHV